MQISASWQQNTPSHRKRWKAALWAGFRRQTAPFVVQALQNHKAGDIIPLQAGNSFQILKLTGVRDPGEQAQQGVRQTHVRHIMMRPSNVTPEKVVIQRLNEIKSRLDKGDGDFQTLARLHSADPSGTAA